MSSWLLKSAVRGRFKRTIFHCSFCKSSVDLDVRESSFKDFRRKRLLSGKLYDFSKLRRFKSHRSRWLTTTSHKKRSIRIRILSMKSQSWRQRKIAHICPRVSQEALKRLYFQAATGLSSQYSKSDQRKSNRDLMLFVVGVFVLKMYVNLSLQFNEWGQHGLFFKQNVRVNVIRLRGFRF